MLIANRTCTVYVATPHSDKRSEKSEQPDFLLIQPIDEHDLELLDNEVETMLSLSHKTFNLSVHVGHSCTSHRPTGF